MLIVKPYMSSCSSCPKVRANAPIKFFFNECLVCTKTKSGLNIHSEIQVKKKSMSNWGAGTTGDHVAPPLYEYERSASFHFHSQSFLAFLQPTLPFPAGQTIECRSLVFLRRPPFYKPEAPLVFFIQSLTTDTH